MLVCPKCGQENPEWARFCNACAALLPPQSAAGTRKTVTVLFCDLVGSTALGDHADPEVLRELMGGYHARLREILERHGGTVEKFVGDAAMAVFGIPRAHEDDALRAVRAASEIRTEVSGLGLEVRIGVNTGEVAAGEGETLITGDAVNVAARLEQSANPGEILLGGKTHHLVREEVEDEPVERLTLKGKAEAVLAYRLLDVPADTRALTQQIGAPFVGRVDELETLQRALAVAVDERAPQLATIVGPPGIGKSRLAHELIQSASARVLVGRCLSYGEGITYWPLAEIIGELGDVRGVFGDDGDADLAVSRIAAAVGTTETAASPDEIAWGFRMLFERLAREQPLIVVFDDIHWAEPTLLDLIEYMTAFAQDASLLLLCTSRPDLFDLRPAWATPKPNASLLALEPLAAEQAELLVEMLHELPQETKTRIVERAEGNPLFVEQLVAMQAEGRSDEPEIPATIRALLAARIDRLEQEERAVIERAAVEGRMFHRGSVQQLLPDQARARVGGQLMALVRKEFIRPDRSQFPGDDGFRFAHILIREAAYESIPKRLRAELHERFAASLEAKLSGNAPREILGYHLEQAFRYRAELGLVDERGHELAKRAGELLGAAGESALARGDMAGAANLLGRADSLLPREGRDRLELLPRLGSALGRIGRLGQADAVLGEAIDGAAALGDERLELLAKVERSSWRLWTDPWNRRDAHAVAERAIELFGDEADQLGLAKSWRLLADVEPTWGANCEALERALDHARRAGDRREEADIRWWLGVSLYFGPTPAGEAIPRCDEILREAKGDRTVEAGTLGILAGLHAMRGSFEQARRLFADSIQILEELGFTLRMASRRTISGAIELLAGDSAAAERELRWGFERLEEIGEHQDLPGIAAQLAEALYRQGRFDEAEHFAERSESEQHVRMRWRSPHAKLLARRGELDRAEGVARGAVRAAAESENLNSQGNTLLDLAEVMRLGGKQQEAVTAAREALRAYEQKGNLIAAEAARVVLANLSASVRGSA